MTESCPYKVRELKNRKVFQHGTLGLVYFRSIQPVPPLPRIAQERVSVHNEYLEILPDAHEHCTDTGYLKMTGTKVRDSWEYDKPYQNLRRAPGTEENSGEINWVCDQC